MVARVSEIPELNAKMDKIAEAATVEFPDSCIICLVIDSEGAAHYVSNIERSDAINALKQFTIELEEAGFAEQQKVIGRLN
jgi:hypothetical protein